MHPIENKLWQDINFNEWKDLNNHRWECFRDLLMEASLEINLNNIKLIDVSLSNSNWSSYNHNNWKGLSNSDWKNLSPFKSWESVRQDIWRIGLNNTWGKLSLKSLNANIEVVSEMNNQGIKIEESSIKIETLTEMIVNIIVSKRNYKLAMLDYLPWYERESIVFNEILSAYDKELRRVEQDLDVVERNLFIDTTIEYLKLYERDLGIKEIPELGYSERRQQVSAVSRSIFKQTTLDVIKDITETYANDDVEVMESKEIGVYEIHFTGKGIPNNLEGLKETLNMMIPAHLGINYIFTFSIWRDIRSKVWQDCTDIDWHSLMKWEGAS